VNNDRPRTRISRRNAIALGGSGLLAASTGLRAVNAQSAGPASIVLDGVTIVDTHDGKLSPNMAIVIDQGKIAKIVRAGSIAAGGSARVIDAHGIYVVPGYNDYHAHPLSSSDPEGFLTLLLAKGITGFREMAGNPQLLAARAAGKFAPTPYTPELLQMASETFTRVNAGTPEIAIAEIAKQKAAGADFIKMIEMGPDVFNACIAECKRQGMYMIGHLAPAVDVRFAATAGLRSMEHMGPRDSLLLGCSSDEAALRQMMAQQPPPVQAPINGPVPLAVIRRALANPTIATAPAEYVRYQRVVDTFSEARSRDLASHIGSSGMWMAPTLIRIRTMEIGDDAAYRNDPNLKYVPKQTVDMWESVSQEFDVKIPQASRDTLRQMYGLQQKYVKPLKAAGVKMIAGSDSGGGFVVPGFGLHYEFDLLEQAGLSPLDVLQMTTLNGAKFLDREATMGSVAEGKNANLVLLSANPMASVQNLHKIAAVVRAGTYHSAEALDGMLKKTEQRVTSGVAYNGTPFRLCC
jgi:imidazolonepropionase-like amidohydrolase